MGVRGAVLPGDFGGIRGQSGASGGFPGASGGIRGLSGGFPGGTNREGAFVGAVNRTTCSSKA